MCGHCPDIRTHAGFEFRETLSGDEKRCPHPLGFVRRGPKTAQNLAHAVSVEAKFVRRPVSADAKGVRTPVSAAKKRRLDVFIGRILVSTK